MPAFWGSSVVCSTPDTSLDGWIAPEERVLLSWGRMQQSVPSFSLSSFGWSGTGENLSVGETVGSSLACTSMEIEVYSQRPLRAGCAPSCPEIYYSPSALTAGSDVLNFESNHPHNGSRSIYRTHSCVISYVTYVFVIISRA